MGLIAADRACSARRAPARAAAKEALAVLEQLGENRAQALSWIDDVLNHQPEIEDAQVLISEVLRIKTGV